MKNPRFSIIIPAYNEAELIGNSIRALKAQTVPADDLEIIVVADARSTDDTVGVAERAGAHKVITEPRPGESIARQSGFEQSQGEIVGYLDADCVPPPDWLARIDAALKDPKYAAVSGPYEYGLKGWQRIADRIYMRVFAPRADRIIYFFFRRKLGVVSGGNFAARRSTMEKIGGWPLRERPLTDAALGVAISRKVGPVLFDPTLEVKSSQRRFIREGFILTGLSFISGWVRMFFDSSLG